MILTKTRAIPPGPIESETALVWSRAAFGPRATFRIETRWRTRPDGEPEVARLTLWVRRAAFPGAPTFDLEIVLDPGSALTSIWTIRATSTFFWGGGPIASQAKLPLHVFHAPDAPASLVFDVPRSGPGRGGQANALLRALFGKRVEADGSLRLLLDRQAHWSVEAVGRPMEALTLGFQFGGLDLFPTVTDADGRTALAPGVQPPQVRPRRRRNGCSSALL